MENEKYLKISQDLEKNLFELKSENDHILSYSKEAMIICTAAFLDLKNTIRQTDFFDRQDEIEFFKNIKPKVYSKLIYFTNIFSIESKRPHSSNKVQRKYLNAELDKLQIFVNDNLDFYKYYKCNDTLFDTHYFVREMAEIRPCIGSLHFLVDPDFSTSHDNTVAVFIANENLSTYLKLEIAKLDSKFGNSDPLLKEVEFINFKYFWTDTKIALIEIIYAFDVVGVIKGENGKKIEIKKLAEFFGKILHIDLREIYVAFSGMKDRKKDRTKFLDYLRDSLIGRMDKDDQ